MCTLCSYHSGLGCFHSRNLILLRQWSNTGSPRYLQQNGRKHKNMGIFYEILCVTRQSQASKYMFNLHDINASHGSILLRGKVLDTVQYGFIEVIVPQRTQQGRLVVWPWGQCMRRHLFVSSNPRHIFNSHDSQIPISIAASISRYR